MSQNATGVTVSEVSGCQNYKARYSWGPEHLYELGLSVSFTNSPKTCYLIQPPSPTMESLHWDGDTLLFATNSSGALDDVKLDASADYTPGNSQFSGVTIWGRAPDGTLLGCHNSSAYGLEQFASYRLSNYCVSTMGTPMGPTQAGTGVSIGGAYGAVITQPGEDGYSDGANVFQGVRAFDPNLGSFTTPDAYAGDLHDPMSLKPYVWDGNNPYEYSDPSGYCTKSQIAANPSCTDVYVHWNCHCDTGLLGFETPDMFRRESPSALELGKEWASMATFIPMLPEETPLTVPMAAALLKAKGTNALLSKMFGSRLVGTDAVAGARKVIESGVVEKPEGLDDGSIRLYERLAQHAVNTGNDPSGLQQLRLVIIKMLGGQ